MRVDDSTRPIGSADATNDPRLLDPPKPLLRVEGRPDLAAKIAKLSEGLSAEGASAPAETSGRAPHPGLITSGSLDEARAYLTGIQPAPGEDPITMEIQRVHIADDVIAASWVTERIEKPAQTQLPGTSAPTARSPNEDGALPRGYDEARGARRQTRARVAVMGVLIAGFVAVFVGYGFLMRQPPSRLFLKKASAAIYVPEELVNATDALIVEQALREQAAKSAAAVKPTTLGAIAALPAAGGTENAGKGSRVATPLPWRPSAKAHRPDDAPATAPAPPTTSEKNRPFKELIQYE